ncbi:carbohydrate ABC transporter ATP-binding protein (CUT1 family) [Brevibacterium sanguinis]|uniref:Carbohydrate ABC transporter ATP-binding protein (CUT1 family) n=2 Tax=Brevibacterium TaxID=1696 RepID=A0A366ICU3_9MICO|nr:MULTISPECIES: ATP-binding cassette domain-containing protein [Brevibacterium]RBP62374.1 carbohydrate ABC transporter ATP-binding protein (CUT1 family) [Brevibacterium sanguinis]RBP68763.1 carbohydrate ABC transporter ATP-binding protein (CUT1 family) [Brevibacterium celere]
MSEIQLKSIDKRYADGYQAISDVSLSIADGEFVILVGPSGSGKSTLLRMIVGLEDITGGELLIDGELINDAPPRDRDLAMVFQNYALYPHLTVGENIAFPLLLAKGRYTRAEIDQRVRSAAKLLELEEHLDRKPANLSGGQRQRVAMGRAIVRDAKAFLFDEPLSNLDAKLRIQMRTEISRMQRSLGVTTVYVTHDQTEAMTLGDKVAVLKMGVLQQYASPQELYDEPMNLFVAGFIGSPPMNFLPVENADGELRSPFGAFSLPPERQERLHDAPRFLIAGVRPEDIHDAAQMDDAEVAAGAVLHAEVDVTEWLGHEVYAYIPFEAAPQVAAALEELDRDLDGEGMRTQIVAALDASTTIREGDEAKLWFDPAKVKVFDPETGRNLTRDESNAARLAEASEAARRRALERAGSRRAD